jgi:UDP-glucose 4-epimerase
MRLLITGGFGYLGGRLALHLASQSHYEIVLGSRKNAESPPWLSHARVVQTRWDSSEELEGICAGVDAVVHMAGMNAQDCAVDPAAALKFNGVGTAKLLQAAIRQGVKRFIYLSTAHIYDSPLSGVITEQKCPVNLHSYATSHRAGEDVVRAAHQRKDIEGVVIRLSNAYGAPIHKDANCWMLLVNDLCHQAVMTRRMMLRSAGMQRRDFITLSDACSAAGHLLTLPNDKLGDGLFNVGGHAIRVIDMAEIIQARCLAVLGFIPEIIRPEPIEGEISPDLDYCIGKLLATGFSLGGDCHNEIDATLHLCSDAFGGCS